MVMSRGYDPFIVFSFSKRECEGLALSLAGLDLNSPDEAALVEGVFRYAGLAGRAQLHVILCSPALASMQSQQG
jgi:hypothetical protein